MSLLEVILTLAVLGSVTVGVNQLADHFAEDTRSTVAAAQVRTFGEAARSYIRDNYAAVHAIASATAPALVDLPTLVAAGRLPPGYQERNAFGQSLCVLVFAPVPNRLQAMVIAEGGSAIGDPSLGNIAAVVGGSGGGIYASDPSQVRGAAGGWSLAAAGFDNKANHLGRRCDGTAGNVRLAPGRPVMALWFENGDTASAFVARDAVPGRPELNAMNTPLVMNALQALNAACSAPGAIARDANGGVLSCHSGTWKAVGDGRCIATTADLDTLQADGRCYNGSNLPNSPAGANWVFVEVFRHVNAGLFYLVQRVVGMEGAATGKTWMRTQNSGAQAGGWTSWKQIADPDVVIGEGNISVRKSVNAESLNATGNVAADGNVIAEQSVTGAFIYSTGAMQAANGVVALDGSNWSFEGLPGGAPNAEPGAQRGSANLNDVYLRSLGKWASQLAAAGMSRTGRKGVSFRANADYSWLTVTVSAKYAPFDGTHQAFSQWQLSINGAHVADVHDQIEVGKFGATGHYWAYEKFGVEQKQFNVFVPRGAQVEVVEGPSNLLVEADVRVDLTQ